MLVLLRIQRQLALNQGRRLAFDLHLAGISPLSHSVPDLRDLAMRVFARMSEAHQVLTNDEQRKEYERLMREGGAAPDEQEMVQRVLRAATSFQKAEVLARRSNYEEAEKFAALAVESDPEQAEYLGVSVDGPYKPDHYRY